MSDRVDELSAAARSNGLRIAVAESLTCGTLAATIGKGSAADEWFAGGVIAYQTRTKRKLLGLAPGVDPVSSACAEQLASAVRALLDVEIGLSTTGVGGPDDQDGHPAGTVHIGWSSALGVASRRFRFDGGPERVLEQTIDAAVGILLELTARLHGPNAEPRP